jgi:hypothetical protein
MARRRARRSAKGSALSKIIVVAIAAYVLYWLLVAFEEPGAPPAERSEK